MAKNLEETILQIRQHSRHLVRELDVVKGIYLDTGYTFSQCHVLFELSTHGSLSLMELSEILLVDKSNLSRTVKKLAELELIKTQIGKTDSRQRFYSLTAKGKSALTKTVRLANDQVATALAQLTPDQTTTVIEGLKLYAVALEKSRLQSQFSIRPLKKSDNAVVAQIIREVMTEFQAVGAGYSIGDAEVDDMYSNYRDQESCYFVVVKEDRVVGGGGIGPLKGGDSKTCELRKMFFLPEARGIGMGKQLLEVLMDEAKSRNFKSCYLETLDRMGRANELYKKNQFKPLDKPMGNTGHCSCDRYYLRAL